MYRLVFLTGKFKGRRLAVHQGSILIGRDPECHIHLTDDDEVSRKHAVLEERPDGVYIVDAGSLNRFTVNDQEVREARLRKNDIIQLGKTRIMFQSMEAQVASEARRVGLVQRLTVASVALILLLELSFLVGLSIWHNEGFQAAPPASVTATQAVATVSAPVPSNTVTTPSEDTAVLEDAQARLNELEQHLSDPTNTLAGTEGETASVSEEIRQLRQDVADIREKVQDLEASTNGVAPTGTTAIVMTEEPPLTVVDPDALEKKARQMLEEAQRQAKSMNLIQADQTLERIQIMAPDFLPAYVERAQLFERRGLLKKSGEQWTLVMNKSLGTPLYQQAASERIRIARMDMIRTALKSSSRRDDEESLSKLPRDIRILSIEHQKFPNNDQFDEMRLLRITLKVKPGEDGLFGSDVYVVVNFFDQAKNSGQISLSEVVVPKNALTLDGQLDGGDQRVLTAAYIVPKGFRTTERMKRGEEHRFYGYSVRVLYRDSLQDEDAKPRSLLREAIEAPNPPPAEPMIEAAPVSETNTVQ
jgi:pSer/pThr/pTyr-binding forkhead associated (FHA) protein